MTSPAIRNETRQQHTQTLTPRLQHAVRLLQLSSLDFAQEVQQAMGKNPFLEQVDGPAEGAEDGDSADTPDEPSSHEFSAAAPADADEGGSSEAELNGERDSWQATPGSSSSGSGSEDSDAMAMTPAASSLRQHLRTQVNVLPLSERDAVLACAVIESLDDDGYLRMGLDEIADLIDFDPAIEICEMNTALKIVQSLDPAGVAARNVRECLLLQVSGIEDKADRELAQQILSSHLERLAQRDTLGLARALSSTPAVIEKVCERIRRLDPKPGWRFGSTDVQFVVPDVIVRKVRGNWKVLLNPAVVPRVRLNQVYADLFQRHRDSKHGELAAHLQEARWTVRNVEQRFSTILMVAEAILKRQHHFLDYGPLAMKPLGLREIAQEIGLHESTVCRVTNNKYMATPSGVFELKYFFSRAMSTANGGSCSGTAIRGVIKDMIEAENPASPLSDVDIARQLARQGLTVARRTITKYRQMLKVPAVERRRKFASAAAILSNSAAVPHAASKNINGTEATNGATTREEAAAKRRALIST